MLPEDSLLGQTVQLSGLTGRASLNGALGQVLKETQGRFEVLLSSGGETVAVKQANMRVV